jgi:hypothetical protein
MDSGYIVETSTGKYGEITQDTLYVANGVREQIMRQVIYTKDEQIRQALISLGWKPPKTPNE